jgi:hypothetical protein
LCRVSAESGLIPKRGEEENLARKNGPENKNASEMLAAWVEPWYYPEEIVREKQLFVKQKDCAEKMPSLK